MTTDVNWKKVRHDYEYGGLGVAELSRKYDVKSGTIHSRKNREKWSRKLEKEIRSRTKEIISLTSAHDPETAAKAGELSTDEVHTMVEAAAVANVVVVSQHKDHIAQWKGLLEDMRVDVSRQVKKGYRDVMTQKGPARVDLDNDYLSKVIHRGVDMLSKLITLERKAFGLDEQQSDDELSFEFDYSDNDSD